MNKAWVVEEFIVGNGWKPEVLLSSRSQAIEHMRLLLENYPDDKFRIRRWVREESK